MNNLTTKNYSVVFKHLEQIKETKTVYSIGSETQNIKELRKLSNQLRTPKPISYSTT